MKLNLLTILLPGCAALALLPACTGAGAYEHPDAPVKEVAFTQVHIDDSFWAPRIETNRKVSIPSAFNECEKNGRFDNFAIAGGLKKGEHRGDLIRLLKVRLTPSLWNTIPNSTSTSTVSSI